MPQEMMGQSEDAVTEMHGAGIARAVAAASA